MLKLFCDVLGAICIVEMLVLFTIGNILYFGRKAYYFVKCFRISKNTCLNEKCRYRKDCNRTKWTTSEIERIQILIDSLDD